MDDKGDEEEAPIIEKIQRASRAFRIIEAAEMIVFNELIRIELET